MAAYQEMGNLDFKHLILNYRSQKHVLTMGHSLHSTSDGKDYLVSNLSQRAGWNNF